MPRQPDNCPRLPRIREPHELGCDTADALSRMVNTDVLLLLRTPTGGLM
jgi:hypothetical protein